jgi:transposase InsO family protein
LLGTPHPTADWIARQITEAFPWNEAPRYLIRDRDQVYGIAATRRLRAMGIRDKPIAPGSPWQNGFAERLIGSIRRECVDVDAECSMAKSECCTLIRSSNSSFGPCRVLRD